MKRFDYLGFTVMAALYIYIYQCITTKGNYQIWQTKEYIGHRRNKVWRQSFQFIRPCAWLSFIRAWNVTRYSRRAKKSTFIVSSFCCLRKIMNIKWQDQVFKNEKVPRAKPSRMMRIAGSSASWPERTGNNWIFQANTLWKLLEWMRPCDGTILRYKNICF